jgi:hypothetical protein
MQTWMEQQPPLLMAASAPPSGMPAGTCCLVMPVQAVEMLRQA